MRVELSKEELAILIASIEASSYKGTDCESVSKALTKLVKAFEKDDPKGK